MQIRQLDPTSGVYEHTLSFGEGDVELKHRTQRQMDKREQLQQRRLEQDYRKGQQALQNCKECFYNMQRRSEFLFQTVVASSAHWVAVVPSTTRWLLEAGQHLQLLPKGHFTCTAELDEDVFADLKSFQKQLCHLHPDARTVFIERSDSSQHLVMDAVAVSEDVDGEEVDVLKVDLESTIRTHLQQVGKEFSEMKTTSKDLIDTRGYKGDLSRYLPTKGKFTYVHFDIDAKGGFLKVIEEGTSFSKNQALQLIAEGALGHTMFSAR